MAYLCSAFQPMIRHVYRRTRGELTIIGVGGVFTAKDAYEKITSGAIVITTMIFDGPQNINEINRGLVRLLEAMVLVLLMSSEDSQQVKNVQEKNAPNKRFIISL